jgi:hypothetical protein
VFALCLLRAQLQNAGSQRARAGTEAVHLDVRALPAWYVVEVKHPSDYHGSHLRRRRCIVLSSTSQNMRSQHTRIDLIVLRT